MPSNSESYDVTIIGAGVVGCAIARELSKYSIKVLVIEKEADVSSGTSKANSGVIHAGFNNPPGSLKAKYCVEGNKMFPQMCEELDVPYDYVGKLVVAAEPEQIEDLEALMEKGRKNSVPGLELIKEDEIKRLEPNIYGHTAMLSTTSGIIEPFYLTIALAENACEYGVEFMLNTEVQNITVKEKHFLIHTQDKTVKTDFVVNSAGLSSDKIANMIGFDEYKIYPCRCEYLILDKSWSDKITKMIYTVTPRNMEVLGVQLTPTIEGNTIIGPSAEFVNSITETNTTGYTAKQLFDEAKQLLPILTKNAVIQTYAGLRSKIVGPGMKTKADFIINDIDGFINLIGIESPGLTAAPALAKRIKEMLEKRLELKEKPDYNPKRKGITKFRNLSTEEKAQIIKENSNYGQIVCRCETITKQEIIDAIRNPLGVKTINGIKFRCRATMGRCGGGFCTPKIIDIMKEEGINPMQITLKGKKSKMFTGYTREY